MHFRRLYLCITFLVTTKNLAQTLILPPQLAKCLTIFQPRSNESLSDTQEINNLTTPNINASRLGLPYAVPTDVTAKPQCNGEHYGFGISKKSCLAAISNVPWRSAGAIIPFGDRGQGRWDNQLPIRWLSRKLQNTKRYTC